MTATRMVEMLTRLIARLLCGNFLTSLPKKPIMISIFLPTLYLWIVDFFSLQRGTWVIERGTKLDIRLGGTLDLE
jgi:15-cis-phytoene synthase/lycopene beta-cyclase